MTGDDPGPDDPGAGGRTPELARLEAALWLAGGPIPADRLAEAVELAGAAGVRRQVERLNALYDTDGSAVRVEELGDGYQLLSRPEYAPLLRRVHGDRGELGLSGPALETLAIVAYRQPVVRAEIEAIRGVQCGEVLRQLLDRRLVRIAGRGAVLGRPLLYGTTPTFLRTFGLRSLGDLPAIPALRPPTGRTPRAGRGRSVQPRGPSP